MTQVHSEPPALVPQSDRFTLWASRMYARQPGWFGPLAVLACIGGAIGYTIVTHPTQTDAGMPPSCLVKMTTGFDCPGCGGTRAAWYLLHGDVPAAARHHLLFVFAVPFLLYGYIAWAGSRAFGWKLPQISLGPKAIGWFLGVWAVFSILRNLPFAPFTVFYV
jgi:hypothetical protein